VSGVVVTARRRRENLRPVVARSPAAARASGHRRTASADADRAVAAIPEHVVADLERAVAAVPEPVAGLKRAAAAAPEREVATLEPAEAALMVQRAAQGDQRAWKRLVDQYARLIWSITRQFKLSESDAADVSQATWLRLLEHIDRLDHPDRVGSWLAATARNECLRSLAARKKVIPVQDDITLKSDVTSSPEVDERLLADERAAEVRKALSHLPGRWQQLLEMLMSDPPATYAEISDKLGLPVGSIGPTRGRCLEMLRGLLQAS
jgi:RNA polymerase sigma factor (sigma-70 family)